MGAYITNQGGGGSSGITGSGTANTLSMFTGTQTIGNSNLSQSGTTGNLLIKDKKGIADSTGNSLINLGNSVANPAYFFSWTNDAGASNDASLYMDHNYFEAINTTLANQPFIMLDSNGVSLGDANGLFQTQASGIGANVRGIQMNGSLMYVYHATGITFGTLTSTTTQVIGTTGSPSLAVYTGAAHTTLTSAECIDINFNLARTVQFAAGSFATQRAYVIQAPTYAIAGGGGTITKAATFAITGAPATGTGATINNAYSLWVQAGLAQFDGNVTITGTATAPTASANDNSTKLATTAYVDDKAGGSTKTVLALTDGATITWNYASGFNSKVTLGGNRALSITNPIAGTYGTIVVTQDGTGGRTLSAPSGSKVANGGAGVFTLSSAIGAVDVLNFYYDGTNYWWTVGNNFT